MAVDSNEGFAIGTNNLHCLLCMSCIVSGDEDKCVVVGCKEIILARSFCFSILTVTSNDVERTTHRIICTRLYIIHQFHVRAHCHRVLFLEQALHPFYRALRVEQSWMLTLSPSRELEGIRRHCPRMEDAEDNQNVYQ